MRRLADELKTRGLDVKEEVPGRQVVDEADIADLRPRTGLGPPRLVHLRDRPARARRRVLERFKVHGVSGLRVVDASVFPRIPGLFIVSAVS